MLSQKTLLLSALLALAWLPVGFAARESSPNAAVAADEKLPKGAFGRIGTTQFRTGDGILSLAYSPDGKVMASGGRNDAVRLWDVQTGTLLRELGEHWVWTIAFTPDGKYLATGGANKIIRLWNVETGKEVRQMVGHKATVKSLVFFSDGAALVSGGDDHMVRLWKVVDGSEMGIYQKHTFGVNAVAISPDNKHFASASTDRTVRIWEYGDKAVVLEGPAAMTGVAYLPDRKSLVTAGDDGRIRVWDIASGKELRQWQAHDKTITHLCLSQDGKTLASGSGDESICLWDVAKGTPIHKLPRLAGDGDALALSCDGKRLAAGGLNNSIRRWDTASGKPLPAGNWPEGAIAALGISPNGTLAAAAFTSQEIIFVDPLTGARKAHSAWKGGPGDVMLSFSPDGQTLALAHPEGRVTLEKSSEAKLLALPRDDEIRCLDYSPDGQKLAIGYTTGGLRIWDIAAAKIHEHLPMPRGARAVAYSRDGKALAVAAEEKIIVLGADYQTIREYGKLQDTPSCLAFSPDGRTLAVAMFSGTIKLFDLTAPQGKGDVEPRTMEGHRGAVNALAWSANGRCLVSAGYDKTVRVWEFVNAQPIHVWPGHVGEVTGVAFHPSGRVVLSSSRDTTILFWDATGRGLQGKLPAPNAIEVARLDEFWKDLASDQNARGNTALWTMASVKDIGGYLAKKVFLTDPKKIKQHLEDLNSNNFKTREKAFAALASYERWIERVLEEARKNPPSEEVRQRLELLLKRLHTKDAITLEQEHLRARRVIEILEQADTPATRELLQGMANGAPDDDLRGIALAAYQRVSKK